MPTPTRSWTQPDPDHDDRDPHTPTWLILFALALCFVGVAAALVIGQRLQDQRLRQQCQQIQASGALIDACTQAVHP